MNPTWPQWALSSLQDTCDFLMREYRNKPVHDIEMCYRYAYEQIVMAIQAGAQ